MLHVPGWNAVQAIALESLLREWAAAGVSDGEAAEQLEVPIGRVTAWRRSLGLPTPGLSRREFAVKCGWPADLSPEQVGVLNFLWDSPGTRDVLAEVLGVEPRELGLADLVDRGLVFAIGKGIRPLGQRTSVSLYMLGPAVVRGSYSPEVVDRGKGIVKTRRRSAVARDDAKVDRARRHR